MKKKILSLFVIVAMILGTIPTVAFAATHTESRFSVHVNKENIHMGDKFTVTVRLGETIEEEEDITNVQGKLYYDKEVVEYVSHQLAKAYEKDYAQGHLKDKKDKMYVMYSRTSMDAKPFEVPAGDMITVTFKAKEDLTESGIKSELRLESALTTSGGVTTKADAYGEVVIGHTPGAEATCTEAQKCLVCKVELNAALGHDMADATCTEASKCTVCGQEEGKALGHTPGAEATCTEAQKCLVCQAELVAALGHTPGAEATCTENQICTVCNHMLVEKLDHAFDPEWTTDGTNHWHACKNAGCTEKSGLEGHIAGSAATCTEDQVCTVCNHVLVPKLDHAFDTKLSSDKTGHWYACKNAGCTEKKDFSEHNAGKDATCTEDQTCESCQYVMKAHSEHNFDEAWTTDGTNHWHACKNAGCTEKSGLEGHKAGSAATCTEAQICTVCDRVLVEKLGHDMADATYDEASKCKREGCNYTEGTTTEAKVKADAKTEVATYKNADDYRDAQKAELKAVIDKAADSIEAAKSEAEVKAAVAEAKVAIDAIKTKNDVIVDSNDSSKDVLDETTKEIVDAATKNPETVTNVDKAVVDAVKEAVEAGETVTTTTTIEVTSIDKKDAENVFGKEHVTLVEKEVGKGTIAQYFDLEVILKVFANGNQTAEGNVTKLEKPITFTIDIPDALKKVADGMERTYFVIRVHDNVVTKLPAKVNADGTLSFETDCFSTYALAYEDIAKPVAPTPEAPKTETPVTGDSNMLGLSLAAMAFAAYSALTVYRKREDAE